MFDLNHAAEPTLEAAAAPAVDDVRQVVADVFAAMLHLDVTEQPLAGEDRSSSEVRMNACVQITGAWQGTIIVDTSTQFARRAAAIVFDLTDDRVTAEDVNDALAELSNMVGGNIKTLLPGPSALSLPAVTEGRDFLLRLPGARLIQRADFTCDADAVRIFICEKIQDAAGRKCGPRREAGASASV